MLLDGISQFMRCEPVVMGPVLTAHGIDDE